MCFLILLYRDYYTKRNPEMRINPETYIPVKFKLEICWIKHATTNKCTHAAALRHNSFFRILWTDVCRRSQIIIKIFYVCVYRSRDCAIYSDLGYSPALKRAHEIRSILRPKKKMLYWSNMKFSNRVRRVFLFFLFFFFFVLNSLPVLLQFNSAYST